MEDSALLAGRSVCVAVVDRRYQTHGASVVIDDETGIFLLAAGAVRIIEVQTNREIDLAQGDERVSVVGLFCVCASRYAVSCCFSASACIWDLLVICKSKRTAATCS